MQLMSKFCPQQQMLCLETTQLITMEAVNIQLMMRAHLSQVFLLMLLHEANRENKETRGFSPLDTISFD